MIALEGKGFAPYGRDLDADSTYTRSFGILPNNTRYVDVKNKIDLRPMIQEKMLEGLAKYKALSTSTGGAGTAGYVLMPVFPSLYVQDLSRKYCPFYEIVPKITCQNTIYAWNQITAKGGGVWKAENADLTDVSDTFVRQTQNLKFGYSVGYTSGPALASIPNFVLSGFQTTGAGITTENPFSDSGAPNAVQLDKIVKLRALIELIENTYINGDTSSDSNEFDGLIVQQSTTNQLDLSGAALEWSHLNTAMQYAWDDGGRPNIGLCCSSAFVDIMNLVTPAIRIAAEKRAELEYGIPGALTLNLYGGPVTFIPSMFMTNVSGSKQIFFLDMDSIVSPILSDVQYMELGATNDGFKYFFKWYGCLALLAPQRNAFIDNIL